MEGSLLLRVVVVGLAAWRVSALLSYERGPFAVFERLRQWVRVGDGPDGQIPDDPWSRVRLELEQALSCVWCLSPWIAAALWVLSGVVPELIAVGAAAAVVVAVERWCHGDARTTD